MPIIKDGVPPIESTMPPYVLQGSMIGRQDKNGPQGDGINEDVSFTLNTTDRHAVAYSIGGYHSEGMKSDNPHAGIHKAEVSRTLDLNGGSPASNQGGIAIVQGTDVYNFALTGETAPALTSASGNSNGSGPKVLENKPYCIGNGQVGQTRLQEVVGTLNCMHDPQSVLVFAQNQRNEVRDLNGRTGSLSAHAGMKQQTYVLQKINGNPKAVTEKYVKTLYKSKNHKDRQRKNNFIHENGEENARAQDKILRILQEAYGEKTIQEWGTAILASLQSPEILRQGMHESSVSGEAENRNELDDNSLPRPSIVAEWLLRDMREQQECGRTPQGRKSTKQQSDELTEIMSKLPFESAQASKNLFGMWQKGKGLWLLQQTLYKIQEIRKSLDGKNKSIYPNTIVRRLTPLEAERLQGYPDHWTDIGDWVDSKGKKHKAADGPRYTALGNSLALPFWQWLAYRLVKHTPDSKTTASLFDGIGGFCLVFAREGCKPIWTSELAEFPIAVTKKRLG